MALRWLAHGRVVLARFTEIPTPADLDALATVIEEVHARIGGERLLVAQLGRDMSEHRPKIEWAGTAGPIARYASVVRKRVAESHSVLSGGGAAGAAFRGLVNLVARFQPRSIVHTTSDEMVFDLANRHDLDAERLRALVKTLLDEP